MLVKEAMSSDAQWVDPGMSLADAAQIMKERDIGALPVGEDDRLIGMVTDRDIVCRGLADGLDVDRGTMRDVMTEGIVYCFEDSALEDAAHVMEKKQIRRLPVLNAEKRLVGMLSLGDIADHGGSHALSAEVIEAVSRHAEAPAARA